MLFGATAAAMKAFRTYGNHPTAMLTAAVDAWFNAYPMRYTDAEYFIATKYFSFYNNWGLGE